MRFVLPSLVTLLTGAAVIAGLAWLVSLILPAAAWGVFAVLFAGWCWIGWEYTNNLPEPRRPTRHVTTT
jgi:hypothetical protein